MKYRCRMKITNEGFYAGQIIGAVCLQGRLVSILRHDGELVRCWSKINAPEARTFHLLPPRDDRLVCWVIDNDLAFGEDYFTVGVAHGTNTDQGMLERRRDFV